MERPPTHQDPGCIQSRPLASSQADGRGQMNKLESSNSWNGYWKTPTPLPPAKQPAAFPKGSWGTSLSEGFAGVNPLNSPTK